MGADRQARGNGPQAMLWAARIALLLPALAIAAAAVPRLISGLALEAAFPATAYMTVNVPLPRAAYDATAQILAHAAGADGETQLLRAEAAAGAGTPARTTLAIAKAGLAHEPASARGWIVLARLLSDRDPRAAAKALSLAIALAPREYYLIVPRTQAGAALWEFLSPETRATLLNDVRLLARTAERRADLRTLLRVPGGAGLVTRALAGNPDELRALNRSLTRERLGL